MKFFITGATGFIGGHLARQLKRQGHEVRALVRNPDKAKALKDFGIQIFQGDITDTESMVEPMTGVDGVFHLAAWFQVGVRDKSPAYKINVEGTRNVLELMQELKIAKGVYTSTIGVFGNTHGKTVDESYDCGGLEGGNLLSEYERTKWQAHYQVALPLIRKGLPLVIVQPGVVFGPNGEGPIHTALVQYLKRKFPMAPQITAYNWQHVEDAVEGHLLAFEKGKPGESYIIGGPAKTLIEFFALAEKITGIPAPKFHPSPKMVAFFAKLMSGVERIIPVPLLWNSESIRVSGGVTYLADNGKAKKELGFMPRPLEESLQETLFHEMKHLGINSPN